ncbi:unnamed protein product, partial [Brenthis ino]
MEKNLGSRCVPPPPPPPCFRSPDPAPSSRPEMPSLPATQRPTNPSRTRGKRPSPPYPPFLGLLPKKRVASSARFKTPALWGTSAVHIAQFAALPARVKPVPPPRSMGLPLRRPYFPSRVLRSVGLRFRAVEPANWRNAQGRSSCAQWERICVRAGV